MTDTGTTSSTSSGTTGPIVGVIERWHQHLRGKLPGGLDALLHPDCVFYSPIVFTPQVGRDITKLYLTAAGSTIGGDGNDGTGDKNPGESSTGFHYTREILGQYDAMLEFESTMDGKYVNGVDIIRCDDSGLITEFKVMLRPLQAVNLVHAQMKAMLEQITSAGS